MARVGVNELWGIQHSGHHFIVAQLTGFRTPQSVCPFIGMLQYACLPDLQIGASRQVLCCTCHLSLNFGL